MKKKLIATAVAGALGAPALAFAQASTVQIYGTIRGEYAYIDQGSSTAPGTVSNTGAAAAAGRGVVKKDFVNNPGGSNMGFKGTESLGGGLNAWFQLETNLQTDGSTGSQFAERNTGVGLNGPWGSVMFGQWDTPYKWATGGFSADETGLISTRQATQLGQPTCGNGQATTTQAITTTGCIYSFGRRASNVIQYWTPNFSGFEGRIAVTASEEKTFSNVAVQNPAVVGSTGLTATAAPGAYSGSIPAGGTATPRLWSVAGRYENGPITAGLAYERHEDYTRAGGTDKAWTIAGAYTFAGIFRLGALYEKIDWDVGTVNIPLTADHRGWSVFGDWAIAGPHSLKVGYSKSDSTGGTLGSQTAMAAATGLTGAALASATAGMTLNACQAGNGLSAGTACMLGGQGAQWTFNGGAGNTGSTIWSLRYAYDFSKRTQLQATYAKINNDSNAVGALLTSGNTAPNAGQSQSGYGVGIRHNF